jgi:signal transduction histidine kinase/ligand-binding sensor domain-containing protein
MADGFKKIWELSVDKPGFLFLSTMGKGFFVLNTVNGQIKQFIHNPKDSNSLLNDTTLRIYPGKKGMLWISTWRGMDRYDSATHRFTHYISKPGDPSTPTLGLLNNPRETPEGDIWFQHYRGMSFYDHQSDQFIGYEEDEKREDGLWGSITSTFVDRSGMIWLGSFNQGLNKESRINQFPLLKNIPGNSNSLQDPTVYSIYEAPSEPGIIWFGTRKGLDRYDKKTGLYKHYRHEEQDRNSISEGAVQSITEDKKGRFWVGSGQGGLNLMDRKKGSFIHYLHDTTNANTLISNDVSSLKSTTDGTLWIGTLDGLDHFDFDSKKFTHYQKADTGYTPALFDMVSRFTTSDRSVAAIIHPANNINKTILFNLSQPTELLVTAEGEIENRNNADWGWIEDASGKSVWDMNITNTVGDGNGRIRIEAIHLDAGYYRLRYRSDENYSYGHWFRPAPYHSELWGIQLSRISADEAGILNKELAKRSYNGLEDNTIFCITEDSKKNIWIGSRRGGVTRLDRATGKLINYMDYFKGPRFITGSILEDKKTGNFWVGDYLFGLLLINSKGEILKKYNASHGLPSNSVLGIVKDSAGILWLSTYNGLCRFDPLTEKFQLYDKKNGLQGLDFYRMSFCQTADGELYFGGVNGVNAFFPDQIKLDTAAPPVIFTDLDIAGKPATLGDKGQMPDHIAVSKEILLPYNQNDLTFHFTSLVFDRGNECQYAYRLLPNDRDWVQAGTIRQARYTSLSPGTYTFSVKAANADGVWNEKGASILIRILPPWWKTWWAYLLYIVAFLLGLFGFIAYRSAALKRENKLLEGKVELRTSQLQSSIENLKATQSQLIQSEKMASLGELTAGIAHEIQNPLNFVNNFSEVNSELIAEMKQEIDIGNLPEVKTIANSIDENERKINFHGKRADAIVKGMLQHSRSSAGVKEQTDINALADEYLRLAYHGLRAKDKDFNATIHTEFDSTIGKINIIHQDIGRVLLNLYNNAFYAVNEKMKSGEAGYEPTVSVSTKKADNKIIITIHDNGNGIPQKVVDKIFQPFFTTKPTGQGTGLGLSLSYDIVKTHGGEIKVNTGEAEFTEFVVQLPIS